MKRVIGSVILAMISAGCNSNMQTPTEVNDSNNKEIELQLLGAATSIESSLNTLAATKETSNPPILNTTALVTPAGGMGGKLDIDWTGPIAPLLTKLASVTGYEVKILGREPAIPVIVSITQNRAIIADILKNASLQAGKNASILVFPANRVIELRYQS